MSLGRLTGQTDSGRSCFFSGFCPHPPPVGQYVLAFLSVTFQSAHLFFCRRDASDSSGADISNKPMLAHLVENALGNDNSISDEVLDNLLQKSEILKELFAMVISNKNNDRAGSMSAHYNLLTNLGEAR